MEENKNITYSKNMNRLSFNTTLNIPINPSVNIKTVLDVNTFVFDQKVDCGNGKAIISGKLGVKILYLDTDNITNSIFDQQSFSENYIDDFITNETIVNLTNFNISHDILSTQGSLKINCILSINPIAYINLSLPANPDSNQSLITKKNELTTCRITNKINTQFEHLTTLETSDNVSKVLCCNSYITPENYVAENGFFVVEGKIKTVVLFESNDSDSSQIKKIEDISNFKYDVEVNDLHKDCLLDLTFLLDKSCNEVSTELEEDNNIINIKNTIHVCGIAFENALTTIVDDLFSTENEIEVISATREHSRKNDTITVCETISNEVTLQTSEPAIDEIVANLNINPEITNTYIKDDLIFVEGVVTSNLIYIDENKEIKNRQVEIPFVINTKSHANSLWSVHSDISVLDNKTKVKRGTVIDTEYSLYITLNVYQKESLSFVNNFNIGKQLDFSKYDFQIFIAKPNETIWDLCKRIKISPDNIQKLNPNLPLVLEGGEKVIIKR